MSLRHEIVKANEEKASSQIGHQQNQLSDPHYEDNF